MIESRIVVILNIFGIILAFFSIVYAAGVVWRVEKKLDVSYKLFLAAVVAYAISLFLEIFNGIGSATMELYIAITKIVFIALFLGGILMMRDLIRDMDGEK
jgi:ABC-type multidrug transport system permease subunit